MHKIDLLLMMKRFLKFRHGTERKIQGSENVFRKLSNRWTQSYNKHPATLNIKQIQPVKELAIELEFWRRK